jgi:hypothetical protein
MESIVAVVVAAADVVTSEISSVGGSVSVALVGIGFTVALE